MPEIAGSVMISETSSNATSEEEEAFFETYDRLDQAKITLGELSIEYGPAKWRVTETDSKKKYSFGWCPASSTLFVDLTEVSPKELTKLLLEDLSRVAESKEAEGLVVAIKRTPAELSALIRSLFTFGFERISKSDTQKLVSNPDVHVLRLEASQECDFVDLEQVLTDTSWLKSA
eukprot:TRINITY_DN430_c0_g2_i2.p2 TRINITY_DN430_c0_g2~~TRINITY_DN430_c0_g2_i2.p2  ORF type:complete len:175 (-),score=20.60 TRINITY_DN430_c0_g2_i2:165-689(-)